MPDQRPAAALVDSSWACSWRAQACCGRMLRATYSGRRPRIWFVDAFDDDPIKAWANQVLAFNSLLLAHGARSGRRPRGRRNLGPVGLERLDDEIVSRKSTPLAGRLGDQIRIDHTTAAAAQSGWVLGRWLVLERGRSLAQDEAMTVGQAGIAEDFQGLGIGSLFAMHHLVQDRRILGQLLGGFQGPFHRALGVEADQLQLLGQGARGGIGRVPRRSGRPCSRCFWFRGMLPRMARRIASSAPSRALRLRKRAARVRVMVRESYVLRASCGR